MMILPELFLQTDPFGIQSGIEIGIIGFSIVLFTLSIIAYKTTGLKKLVYAAGAFALFSFQLFFEYVEDSYDFFKDYQTDIILSAITLGVLILFFLAIVKKK